MPDHPPASVYLPFTITRQPDDVTCGPTCLHAVYSYYGLTPSMEELVRTVPSLADGGTLGVLLATDALRRGFRVTVTTWNLRIFDPTWFQEGAPPLVERLRLRAQAKRANPKLALASSAYADFVEAGGRVEFRDLEPSLLRQTLRRGVPILCGLSATFLYREERQRVDDDKADDIRGDPVGHFVVLSGYDAARRAVHVTDPMHPNALSTTHTYPVGIERLVGAIYLGVLTYDANLIMIEPVRG
ncbi:MAG: hypothetical protein R3F29_10195 [Planctomycetota bacterium]